MFVYLQAGEFKHRVLSLEEVEQLLKKVLIDHSFPWIKSSECRYIIYYEIFLLLFSKTEISIFI